MTTLANILVVEDNSADILLLQRFFKNYRFANQVAYSDRISDAREKLSATPFDLVMLDIRLPDGSGLDLVREIKAINNHTIVICTSTLDDIATMAQAEKAGVDGFLPKPVTWDMLGAMAERLEYLYFGFLVNKRCAGDPKKPMGAYKCAVVAAVALSVSSAACGDACTSDMEQLAKMTIAELGEIRTV